MGISWAEGDTATQCAAVGLSALAERWKTEKLEWILSVRPPSNKMGRIHRGGCLSHKTTPLLALLWIFILFYRFYSVKRLRLIKRRNVYVCIEQISSKSKLICAQVA